MASVQNPKMPNRNYNLNGSIETNEMREDIHIKNALISKQSKRIDLLEEKMAELRKKYFRLKHVDVIPYLRTAQ